MSELFQDHISFSQLRMVSDCPFSYFLLKIAGVKPAENGFSQAGVLAHQLLASWARNEIELKELASQWVLQYPKSVTEPFPAYLERKEYSNKLFNRVLQFFQQFDGYPDHEILGVEKEFVSQLAGEKFVGIVDLILRSKETGQLILLDYKSCSLASFRKTQNEMFRQLILYAKYCADQYGQFPSSLCFSLMKENKIARRSFIPAEFIQVREWAEKQIEDIKQMDMTNWMETNPEYFKCCNLCSARKECKYGQPGYHRKEKDNVEKQSLIVA